MIDRAPAPSTPTLTPDDIRTLHERCPAEDARRAKLMAAALAKFDAAADKAAAAAAIRREYEPQGLAGLSVQSLYRKLKLWREHGAMAALVDGRAIRRTAAGRLADNAEFCAYWANLCADNRRGSGAAYRALFTQLQAGAAIPGVGTWRDIWAAEHGGTAPAAAMQCPYRPYAATPRGWSESSLMRIKPNKYALMAARRGTMAATLACIPSVPRTRAGLECCGAVMIDDMWHEVKVAYAGNRQAQRVVQISMIDVLTGHIIAWLAKPVRERGDGTRETLRQEWMRYFLAHLVCTVGTPAGGCLVMGERGSAKVDDDLARTLAQITGGKVRSGVGGRLSQPLARGLYGGDPRGNPRYKGLLEGFHSLLKNELGATPGHVGGGRAAQPEDVYGMDQADSQLRRIAAALEESRPGLMQRLHMPYLAWEDYMALCGGAYTRIDNRTHHAMEGWENCGFIAGEFRTPDGQWLQLSGLDAMPPERARAWRSLIDSGALQYRTRRMSPAEAWATRAHERRPLGDWAAPLIMGDNLACACKCDDRLQIAFREPDTLRSHVVAGVLHDGTTCERGGEYRVWINPLDTARAYIADASGKYLGVAPVQTPATYTNQKAIERHLGIRQLAISAEGRRLAPIAAARQRRAAEAARHNAVAILGYDPAQDAAVHDAVLANAPRTDVEDLIADTDAEPVSATLDDMI